MSIKRQIHMKNDNHAQHMARFVARPEAAIKAMVVMDDGSRCLPAGAEFLSIFCLDCGRALQQGVDWDYGPVPPDLVSASGGDVGDRDEPWFIEHKRLYPESSDDSWKADHAAIYGDPGGGDWRGS